MIADVIRGNTTVETIKFTMETCCDCGIPFFMPTYHYERLIKNKGELFYCPNGHGQHYTGKTEAQKIKEQLERERLETEEIRDKLLDEINKNKKLELKLKRVHNGVCPCCNRSFKNLQRHIKTKHPELSI